MDDIAITNQKISPAFDMEDFMNFSRETRMASSTLEHLIDLWENWQSQIKAARIQHGQNSWLAIWLPESIEKAVDDAWEKSPGEGFLINSLAQYICMAAIQELLPQTADGGCAPAPEPNKALSEALARLKLVNVDKKDNNLLRRYAILTHYPFRGGCEICAMRDNCPKTHGTEEFASVVLPGHERGITN